MRRTWTWIAGSAALALTLGACGDGGGGGDDAAAGCETQAASLTVGALDELAFDQDAYEADAGCVAVTYVNEGSIAHTLLIRGVDGFKLAVGDEDEGVVELEAGDYELYCDIAGHERAGMVADLTVS